MVQIRRRNGAEGYSVGLAKVDMEKESMFMAVLV